MIKFFRKIREKLLTENKFGKYLIYAIGEIVLVVIGILIALSINNWNENKKTRDREIGFLKNLKSDLISEQQNNNSFREYRFEKAKNASYLLNAHSPPNTIAEVNDFSIMYEQVTFWNSYVPINNTFKELLNSGNLILIKNDSIKNSLLNLDRLYSDISISENHMRREYENYFYDIVVKNTSIGNFFDYTNPKNGFGKRLKVKDIPETLHKTLIENAKWIHNNQTMNNGLKLAIGNNSHLANLHDNISEEINTLIKLIDKDIEK